MTDRTDDTAGRLADYCPGHESLRGDAMGTSVYCDGTCLTGDELADALAEIADDTETTADPAYVGTRGTVEGPGDYDVKPANGPTIDATVTVEARRDEDGTRYWRATVTVPAVPGPGRETTTRDYAAYGSRFGGLATGSMPHDAALDLLSLVLTS